MTLHEAIEFILQESGSPMTSGEIAKIINSKNLYSRRDNQPVSSSQITARVNNYPKIFSSENNKIKLVKNDIASLKLQQFKNKIVRNHGGTMDPKIVIDTIEDLMDENDDEGFDASLISEPSAFYDSDIISKGKKFKIIYELLEWFLSHNRYEIKIADSFATFFSKLEWFGSGEHKITFGSNLSNHFFLKIAFENPHSLFDLENCLKLYKQSSNLMEINTKVQSLLSNKIPGSKISSTAIIIPPFLKGTEWGKVTTQILGVLNFENPKFTKAIMVLPANMLSTRGTVEFEFKQKILRSAYLDSVVLFSSGMLDHTMASVSVLIFDFAKKRNDVYFLDASSMESLQTAEMINQKQQLANISNTVPYEDILMTGVNLNPTVYVWEPEEWVLEPGYNLYTIEDLVIDDVKRGLGIQRKKLYEEGEFKIIRTTEIKEDLDYINPEQLILGVDHDEIRNLENYLKKGGVILSGFNKKLKANMLPKDTSYVIGMDTYWLNLNNKVILDEYFIQEIRKEYVQKQAEMYSRGVTINRLSLNNLLKIKIKVPSTLEMQKDMLLKEMQIKSREAQNILNDSANLDFINTLEHSLRQPASSLGNDLLSLHGFISKKVKSGENLSFEEPVVPVFPTDTPEQISVHSVLNTLNRMQRMVSDIEYIISQAGLLAKAKASPSLELIDLKSFFNNLVAENPDVKIVIFGKGEIKADRKQMRILFNNLIENAKKHGFRKNMISPTIWIDLKSKENDLIEISVKNNGKALPKEFTIEHFLAKGKSTNEAVGSGFGGFLIGQILKNHHGEIELIKEDFNLMEHNVEFLITLPK